MPEYTCERCLKVFSQKSHYDKHMNRKRPCQNTKNTLENVVERILTNTIELNQPDTTVNETSQSPITLNTRNKTQIVVNEDCIEGMKKLQDNSADIIICDPPYNIGKDFGNNSDKQKMDDYLLWCDAWIGECIRILKPAGTLYIYGFSEILAFIRVRININVRWIVWHYTNKVTPSLNFWQRTHESILCCYKEKPIFNKDDVREPYTDTFLKNAAGKVRKATKGRFSNGEKETTYTAHANGALPRDVIKVSALAGGAGKRERVDHPTQKPLELCRKLINASKNGEDTMVIVPFAGSGSECVAAKIQNINFIGYEINEDYVTLCNNRLDTVDIE
jgi:site-specific DNA-methyltransferase (adenine-specific)